MQAKGSNLKSSGRDHLKKPARKIEERLTVATKLFKKIPSNLAERATNLRKVSASHVRVNALVMRLIFLI